MIQNKISLMEIIFVLKLIKIHYNLIKHHVH